MGRNQSRILLRGRQGFLSPSAMVAAPVALLSRLLGFGALVLGLCACSFAPKSAAQSELENIAPWNVIAKSTPRQFVSAIDRFCLAAPKAARKALRSAGYVLAPKGSGGIMTYLVDNRHPAVQYSANGADCAITARSRTGQTNAVHDFVEARFAGATPISPRAKNAEAAWHDAASGTRITMFRHQKFAEPSRLMVLVQRPV